MPSVTVEFATPRLLAAVRRRVAVGEVGSAWRPALDEVWAFLRARPGLRDGGHNIFLYHHPAERRAPMDVDFGVEVVREFAQSGSVRPVRTPAGRVAVATHLGPYEQLGRTHEAVHAWASANGVTFADHSWEIYADPVDDPAKLETTVIYLLR